MNTPQLSTPESRPQLAAFYHDKLLNDVVPFAKSSTLSQL